MRSPLVRLAGVCAILCLLGVAQAQPGPSVSEPQQAFELGLAHIAQGRYAEAAFVLEQLYARTGSERVRLEWARAAYLMRDHEQAGQLFRAVLATEPPPSVREKINFFLDDIALAKGRIDYAFSLTRDSNPRAVPSERSFSIFGLPFNYQPEVDARPQWGVNYRLAYSQGLDEGRRWIATAGLLGTHFADPAFNKAGWDAHLSYRARFEPRLEFKISHESMDLGGSPQYRYDWLTMALWTEPAPRWRVSHELRYGNISYPLFDYQNSTLSSYRVLAERALSAQASAGLDLGADRGRADDAPYSHDGYTYGLVGAYYVNRVNTRVTARWAIAHRLNAASDPIFGVRREDQRQNVNLSFESPSIKWAGLRPVLELGVERNVSTLALANYERRIVSISVKKAF